MIGNLGTESYCEQSCTGLVCEWEVVSLRQITECLYVSAQSA